MDKEALEYSYELFKKDGYNGSIDDYSKLIKTDSKAAQYSYELFKKDGYNDTSEAYKALVGIVAQEVEAEKKAPAKESGVSASPLASTTSSLVSEPEVKADIKASKTPLKVIEKEKEKIPFDSKLAQDFTKKLVDRDLIKEKRDLQAKLDALPIMQTDRETEDRLAAVNVLLGETSMSNYALKKKRLKNIEEDIDKTSLVVAKNAKMSGQPVEKAFESSVELQDLYQQQRNQRQLLEGDNKILSEIKKDTNADVGFGSWVKGLGRMLSVEDDVATETIELSTKVEDEVMRMVEDDIRLKGKLASGNASLPEKEEILLTAKNNVLTTEFKVIDKEYKDIKAMKATTQEEVDIKNEELKKLETKYLNLTTEIGFDKATSLLNNNFKKTTESEKFDNILSSKGFFPSTGNFLSTLGEGAIKVVAKATVGSTAWAMSTIGDVFTDQTYYSKFDAFEDVVSQWTNFNYAPSTTVKSSRIVDDKGDFNLSYQSVTKSLAETLPFTLYLINDIRKGRMKDAGTQIGRLLNPAQNPKLREQLGMVNASFKATVLDNKKEAQSLGLNDMQATAYASVGSLVEGTTELIFPDIKFLEGTMGKVAMGRFAGNLKTAVNKEAVKAVVKDFVASYASELGEEEVAALMKDALKFSMVVGHKNSEFFDIAKQKELMATTLIMSSGMATVGTHGKLSQVKKELYSEVSKNINQITSDLRQELTNPNITAQDFDDVSKTITFANKVHKAMTIAPEAVTGRQIDLLVEKQDLLDEIKRTDDSFHPAIKEKVEKINSEIAWRGKDLDYDVKQKLDNTPKRKAELEAKKKSAISPENSSNYANMTEDDEGNFVFYHYSDETRLSIEPSQYGKNKANITSSQEAAAMATVGGMSMYYTNDNTRERGVGNIGHQVTVPKEDVYDFNTDKDNLIVEAEARFKAEHPDKAFTFNHQLAWVTKIAGEKGYDMTVAEWAGKTRAQSTKPMIPSDLEVGNGDRVLAPFSNSYASNLKKGYQSVIPTTKSEKLKAVYDEIYKVRNADANYDNLYFLYSQSHKYSQEKITELIEQSDLPQSIKDNYKEVLESKEERRKSVLSHSPSIQAEAHNKDKGSTFTLDGRNRSGEKGKASVGIFPERAKEVKGAEISEKDVASFVEANKDLLEGNEDILAVGSWLSSDTGNSVLDIVAVTPIKEAVQLGKDYNQIAVWDLGNFEEIPTGGTGEAIKGLKPEIERVADIRTILEAKKPNIKEKAKSIADNIRNLKNYKTVTEAMNNLQSSPLGVFQMAWDGAVETVATTFELTGSGVQALSDGLQKLKESSWYQSLSEGGQIKASRMFVDTMRNAIPETSQVEKISFYDSMKASYDKTKDVFIQKMIDKYHIVRKTLGSENFSIYNDSVDFSQAEVLMHGRAANDLEIFDKQISKLVHEIADRGFSMQGMSDYLYAKHAKERNDHIRDNVDSENEFGSGMTDKEAKFILEEMYTQEQYKALEELTDKFKEITQGTRDIMLEHGLISREQYNNLTDYYENYVPLIGFENEAIEVTGKFGNTKLDIRGNLVMKSAGRSTRAGNIIANIISERVKLTLAARKNQVLQTVHKLALENPDNGVVRINLKPEKEDVGVKVDGEQLYLSFANKEVARVLQNANVYKADIFTKTLSKINSYLRATMTVYNPEFVLSNFSRDIQTAIVNVMAEADTNVHLDGENLAKGILKDVGKSIKAIYANERSGKVETEFQQYYEEFKAAGAKTGWASMSSLSDIKAKLDKLHDFKTAKGLTFTNAKGKGKAVLDYVEVLNTSVENGVRLSAYVNARRAGLTEGQAGKLAKELTVNFNQKGEMGTVFNLTFLFFNASVQGSVRFVKAMSTLKKTYNDDGSVTKSLNRGQKLAMTMVVASAALAMLNNNISDDDEDGVSFYSKIPDFVKERNLIMMHPNGKEYFTIPLPYGYNIFHNLGTVISEVGMGERSVGNGIGFLTSATVGAFAPVSFGSSADAYGLFKNAFTPTVLKPIMDLGFNEDFFGGQIYNENFPFGTPKPDSSLGRSTTPAAFTNISKFLNEITGGNEFESGKLDFAPESLYYLYKFGVGGTGKFLTNIAETTGAVVRKVGGREEKIEARKLPFVRKVFGEPNKYVDQSIYFDRQKLMNQRLETIKMEVREKGGLKNVSDADKKLYANFERTYKVYESTSKKLAEIRATKKEVSKNPDPIKRSAQLQKLDDLYFSLMKRTNKVFNERLGKNYE